MEKQVKDIILKRTVEDTGLPEDIVEKVISWSYKKANDATRFLKEVEISGLGTFMVSPSKSKKKIYNLIKTIEALELKIQEGRSKNQEDDERKIVSCREAINYCLSKLSDEDRSKQDFRGFEQSLVPTSTT